MESYLDYINKKLNEDKVVLSTNKIIKKSVEKETKIFEEKIVPKPVITKTKSDASIAKDILEGVSEEITKYTSKYFVEADTTVNKGTYTDESGNTVIFNKNVSEDTKKASMLLDF